MNIFLSITCTFWLDKEYAFFCLTLCTLEIQMLKTQFEKRGNKRMKCFNTNSTSRSVHMYCAMIG